MLVLVGQEQVLQNVGQRNGAASLVLRRSEDEIVVAEELDLATYMNEASVPVDVSGERPKISPWRRPRPIPRSTTILNLSGRASRTAMTLIPSHGIARRRSSRGARTDRALHGFFEMSPSSTAAEKTVETLVKTECWEFDEARLSPCSQLRMADGSVCLKLFDPRTG